MFFGAMLSLSDNLKDDSMRSNKSGSFRHRDGYGDHRDGHRGRRSGRRRNGRGGGAGLCNGDDNGGDRDDRHRSGRRVAVDNGNADGRANTAEREHRRDYTDDERARRVVCPLVGFCVVPRYEKIEIQSIGVRIETTSSLLRRSKSNFSGRTFPLPMQGAGGSKSEEH